MPFLVARLFFDRPAEHPAEQNIPAEQMKPEVKRTYLNKLSVKSMNIYI